MIKYLFIVLLICCFTLNAEAQNDKKESLLLQLQTATSKDKIKILMQLSELSATYVESINFYSRALIIANEIKDIDYQADINFSMGKAHCSEGKYTYSEKRFLEALGLYQMKNDSASVATSYYWLALCNKYRGKYQNAIKYAQLCLDLNEKLKLVNGIVEATLVFGDIYLELDNQKQAEVYFNQAYRKINKKEYNSNLGFALLGKGNVLLTTSKRDSAKLLFDESYHVFINTKSIYGQASALLNTAQYYILVKDYKKAGSTIDKSLGIFKSINNKKAISQAMMLKGDLYFNKGTFSRAIELYLSGQKLALQMEAHKEILKNYKTISKAYESRKDMTKAMKYFKLYSELKDSVSTSETLDQLSDMESKYETEKKELENKYLITDKEFKRSIVKKQYILVSSVIFILGLIAALVIILIKEREKEKKNNEILERQKKEIDLRHQQFDLDIDYAGRIQGALLPDTTMLSNTIKDHFVLCKPRDLVSGDFYWMKQLENQLVVVVADCTGHDVPGAFMSLLGISFLTEIISMQIKPDAAEILEKMRHMIKLSLKQDNSDNSSKDGIDLALCIINTNSLELQFAGANMPMYLIRKGKLEIIKGINNPIGIYLKEKPFENVRVQLKSEDIIYLFTDGYVDQFGGKKSEKFKPTHFRDALLAIHQSDMDVQKQLLEDIFEEWKSANNEQTDDVLVVGLKV